MTPFPNPAPFALIPMAADEEAGFIIPAPYEECVSTPCALALALVTYELYLGFLPYEG